MSIAKYDRWSYREWIYRIHKKRCGKPLFVGVSRQRCLLFKIAHQCRKSSLSTGAREVSNILFIVWFVRYVISYIPSCLFKKRVYGCNPEENIEDVCFS